MLEGRRMQTNSALLVMDIQRPIINEIGDKKEEYLQKLQGTIEAAREKNVPIIQVIVGFRSNMPEFNVRSKGLRVLRDKGIADALVNPMPILKLTETDILITRPRVSAFAGSDLEIILRSLGVEHLVLAGISTSGVVLSTLRAAYDKDYELTVLADLCGESDEEVHRVLTEKVFPRRAEVISSTEWLGMLPSAQ